jgi:hypothetical protein
MLKLTLVAAALLLSTPAFAGSAAIIVRSPHDVLVPVPPSHEDHLIIVGGPQANAVIVSYDPPTHCVLKWTTVEIGGVKVRRATRHCH